jgi:hypothetical protein
MGSSFSIKTINTRCHDVKLSIYFDIRKSYKINLSITNEITSIYYDNVRDILYKKNNDIHSHPTCI